jgi:hypothetical protein
MSKSKPSTGTGPLVNDAFSLAVTIAYGLNLVLPKSRRARLAYLRAADRLAKALAEAEDMAGQAALRGLQAGLESRSPEAEVKAEEVLTDSLGRLAACIALWVTEKKKRRDRKSDLLNVERDREIVRLRDEEELTFGQIANRIHQWIASKYGRRLELVEKMNYNAVKAAYRRAKMGTN